IRVVSAATGQDGMRVNLGVRAYLDHIREKMGVIEFETEAAKRGFFRKRQAADKTVNGITMWFKSNRTFEERDFDKTLEKVKYHLIEADGIDKRDVRINWGKGEVSVKSKRVAQIVANLTVKPNMLYVMSDDPSLSEASLNAQYGRYSEYSRNTSTQYQFLRCVPPLSVTPPPHRCPDPMVRTDTCVSTASRRAVVLKPTLVGLRRSRGCPDTLAFTDETQHLFRGVSEADGLTRFGAIFEHAPFAPEERYYNSSQCVRHLDFFFSHNWAMPRWTKFLTLAVFLNMRAAVLVTSLVAVILMVFVSTGHLPTLLLQWEGRSQESIWCQVCGIQTFMCIILFRQHVLKLCRQRGKSMFIDKACIHQVNADLKEQGILHLAAFLYHSTDMVVCFSDLYLRKLWTVYEVAVFLTLNPGRPLLVRHALLWKTLIVGISLNFCYNMTGNVVHIDGVYVHLGSMTYYTWLFFALLVAECFVEDDRALVEENVLRLMRHRGFVYEAASDAEVISEFESLVRRELPLKLAASFGRSGIPYPYVACMTLPYLLQNIDGLAVDILHREAALFMLLRYVHRLSVTTAVFPLAAALLLTAADRLIQRSWGPKATVTALALCNFLLMSGVWACCESIAAAARRGSAVPDGLDR
ncbi:unnamed protein product, partial [Prorocentrum cordatum]